jgi:hypothetical protein
VTPGARGRRNQIPVGSSLLWYSPSRRDSSINTFGDRLGISSFNQLGYLQSLSYQYKQRLEIWSCGCKQTYIKEGQRQRESTVGGFRECYVTLLAHTAETHPFGGHESSGLWGTTISCTDFTAMRDPVSPRSTHAAVAF